jgi:hypothetical protein
LSRSVEPGGGKSGNGEYMKNPRSKGERRQGGTSLLEFVIAFTILTVAFLSLAMMASSSFLAIEEAEDISIATFKLESVYQQIHSTPYSNMKFRFPDGGTVDFDSIDSNPSNNLKLPGETITVTYTDISADPMEIIVTIRWKDKKGNWRNLFLRTLRTK